MLLECAESALLLAVLGLIGVGAAGASRVHERNKVWRAMERRLDDSLWLFELGHRATRSKAPARVEEDGIPSSSPRQSRRGFLPSFARAPTRLQDEG